MKKYKVNRNLEAPEGYFENFEQSVFNRITELEKGNEPKKTKIIYLRWISAAAAAVLLILGGVWMFKQPDKPILAKNHPTTVTYLDSAVAKIEAKSTEEVQNTLVEKLIETETVEKSVTQSNHIQNAEDQEIMDELEAAGLISGDSGESLMDEIEI